MGLSSSIGYLLRSMDVGDVAFGFYAFTEGGNERGNVGAPQTTKPTERAGQGDCVF